MGPPTSVTSGEALYVEFTPLTSKCTPICWGWRNLVPLDWNHLLLLSNAIALISSTSLFAQKINLQRRVTS